MSLKINANQAENIGYKIAEKAFEHLMDPIDKALSDVGQEAYDKFAAQVDVALLIKFHLLNEVSGIHSMAVIVTNAEEANVRNQLRINFKNSQPLAGNAPGYEEIMIYDPELFERGQNLQSRWNELHNKRSALRHEVVGQCRGKNPATLVKAWPEAEDIIREVITDMPANISGVSVPLENLLAKFLPMLAAPKGE